MANMFNWGVQLRAWLAVFMACNLVITGCSSGRGIGGSMAPVINVRLADLDGDGDPDRNDNCPGLANPPTEQVMACPGCTLQSQCFMGAPETATLLADGTPIPVATNKKTGASSPVGVWLVGEACLVQSDTDWDGIGNVCDADDDGDKISDATDNCPLNLNQDQLNTDGAADGGNACDPDDDNDGVLDTADKCPLVVNADQTDTDGDGVGDACEDDKDGDNVLDAADNCPLVPNPDQLNTDGDTYSASNLMTGGDACDTDDDGDLDPDTTDCAPLDAARWNGNMELCNGIDDSCSGGTDEGFLNTDGDAQADCVDTDDDNDDVLDTADNCPLVANAGQENLDGDTMGNACDPDDDNDGVLDTADNCPMVMNASQSDTDQDGLGDACDQDCDGDGVLDTVPCNLGDLDGDGFDQDTTPPDCLEGDPTVYPGAKEVCNNADDDCDGLTDEDSDICAPWELCKPTGCEPNPDVPQPECVMDTDCDDKSACTTDMCGVGQICVHTTLTCDDGSLCTADTCNPATGCVHTAKVCDDANKCTDDTCAAATGNCVFTAKVCDDANKCTTDSCNSSSGACEFVAVTCAAGKVCNTANGACEVPPECVLDADCNDSNACTQNFCAAGVCTYPAVTCPAGQFCDASNNGMCTPNPAVGQFNVTFTLAAADIPSNLGLTECRLVLQAKASEAASSVLEAWGIKATASITAGQPTVITWSKAIPGLGWFEAQAYCINADGTQSWYAASCTSPTTCSATGRLDFKFYDGATMWSVIKLGVQSTAPSVLHFVSNIGVDTDGDGLPDASDSSPWDGSLPAAPM